MLTFFGNIILFDEEIIIFIKESLALPFGRSAKVLASLSDEIQFFPIMDRERKKTKI